MAQNVTENWPSCTKMRNSRTFCGCILTILLYMPNGLKLIVLSSYYCLLGRLRETNKSSDLLSSWFLLTLVQVMSKTKLHDHPFSKSFISVLKSGNCFIKSSKWHDICKKKQVSDEELFHEKADWHFCPMMSALSMLWLSFPAHEFFVLQCFSSCDALPSLPSECSNAQWLPLLWAATESQLLN